MEGSLQRSQREALAGTKKLTEAGHQVGPAASYREGLVTAPYAAVAEQLSTAVEGGLSILIVDDDPGMRETLSDILEDKGLVVATAESGETAIQRMRETSYDLVLIDIMMPGMNGVETLRQIKTVNPKAATVVMTGHSQLEGLVSEALWAGVDGVLYKPFDIDAVIEMIETKSRDVDALPVVDLKRYQVDPEALRLVPEAMARKYVLIPLRVDQGHLIVAMADPTNLYANDDLRLRTGLRIKSLKATQADIEGALDVHYQGRGEIERQIERIAPAGREAEEAAERLSAEFIAQAPVVRSVDLMLGQAVKDRASDIHLEPQEGWLRARYRIDGVLHEVMRLPLRVHASLLSRLKVLANLNIAERRRPQDGQFSTEVDGHTVDFRVATMNTIHGEMVALRVLDKAISLRELGELGFQPDVQQLYEQMAHSPWGMLLISGPTGSGKTTTLYATINRLDRVGQKIVTIEDPVEYRFEGISQVQVNRRAGITFANGLRAILRLDPDIVLVGEIRDQETASTAVHGSLTGHLVLSSIHANDAVGALFRLVDLGVDPFLITSSLLGVVSQRLLRRTCNHCRMRQEVPYQESLAYEQEMGEERTLFDVGLGCNFCADTGYRGRIGVFELLRMNDRLRRMVLQGATSDELRSATQEAGVVTMFHDGMLKVKAGITTPAEVMREVFTMT